MRSDSLLRSILWCGLARHSGGFGIFEYAWEVYKPVAKRRWGYYVLPILYQDRFVARFDGRFDRTTKTLDVLAYYEEADELPLSHPVIYAGFQRFLVYLNGEQIKLPTGEIWKRGG